MNKVRELLDPFDKLPLECDGFTYVAHYALVKAGIDHTVFCGEVEFSGKRLPIHFWIMLDSETMVDYRLRMWFGEQAPHGVFDLAGCGVEYDGTPAELEVNDFMFKVLTSG